MSTIKSYGLCYFQNVYAPVSPLLSSLCEQILSEAEFAVKKRISAINVHYVMWLLSASICDTLIEAVAYIGQKFNNIMGVIALKC